MCLFGSEESEHWHFLEVCQEEKKKTMAKLASLGAVLIHKTKKINKRHVWERDRKRDVGSITRE